MRIHRSSWSSEVLVIRHPKTDEPVVSYHSPSRTFGVAEGLDFKAIPKVEASLPKEAVARCIAYSMTGILAEQP